MKAAAWLALTGALAALVWAVGTRITAAGPAPRWVAAATRAPDNPPTRLRIDTIGVDTPLEALRLDAAGALTPPQDFALAGWYAEGSVPGDAGPAVIAGHIDSYTGPAVFARLRDLDAGDTVEVDRGGRRLTFRVLAVKQYPKDRFPTDEVYAPTPNAQLRLITCGGSFDRAARSYRDNVVVYAVLA